VDRKALKTSGNVPPSRISKRNRMPRLYLPLLSEPLRQAVIS
jgi:hypothetical protein